MKIAVLADVVSKKMVAADFLVHLVLVVAGDFSAMVLVAVDFGCLHAEGSLVPVVGLGFPAVFAADHLAVAGDFDWIVRPDPQGIYLAYLLIRKKD
jgi:hypothetical protein